MAPNRKKLAVSILASLIFIALGVSSFVKGSRYSNGVDAVGEIVDYEVGRSSGDSTYTAVIEFVTLDGETVTIKSGFSSSSRPQIGKSVDVSYRVDDPHGARHIASSRYIFLVVFVGIGIAILVFTIRKYMRASLAQASPIVGGPFVQPDNQEPPQSIIR